MDIYDPKGMVATYYVSENGEDITVEWYSTVNNHYYKLSNNYTFKINVIEKGLTLAAIIGIIAGAVVLVGAFVLIIVLKNKKKNK